MVRTGILEISPFRHDDAKKTFISRYVCDFFLGRLWARNIFCGKKLDVYDRYIPEVFGVYSINSIRFCQSFLNIVMHYSCYALQCCILF